jgi:hypothetical protein
VKRRDHVVLCDLTSGASAAYPKQRGGLSLGRDQLDLNMRLPLELVGRVFSLLPEVDERAIDILTPDYRTLATLACTSRLWLVPARHHMYRDIVVLDDGQWVRITDSLLHHPSLRPLVKHLSVWYERRTQAILTVPAAKELFTKLQSVKFMDRQCSIGLLGSLAKAAPKTLLTMDVSIEGEGDMIMMRHLFGLHPWKKVTLFVPRALIDHSPTMGYSSIVMFSDSRESHSLVSCSTCGLTYTRCKSRRSLNSSARSALYTRKD